MTKAFDAIKAGLDGAIAYARAAEGQTPMTATEARERAKTHFEQAVSMTENDALAAISAFVFNDSEPNKARCDSIIKRFLRAQGYGRLADAMNSVD